MFERYQTQMNVEEFGEDSQIKLQMSTVLVAGIGGLGLHVSKLLGAAGVGTLLLCDPDQVAEKNLHRQLFQNAVGRLKVGAAFDAIMDINPNVHVYPFAADVRMFLEDYAQVYPKFDLILDCVDNSAGRKYLHLYSIKHNIPLISAGVGIYKGQIVQYNENTPFMGDGENPKISAALGPVCSTIASLQAMFALNYLTGKQMEHNYIQINLKTFDIDKMRI